ncbi:MAG: DUF1178 family protein [Alphaproteobacteria bacterium]|nr:DUF1178 family protein [Alphaproteobacteria bacterium]
MILYQLRCDKGHEFEAWFKGIAGFDEQSRQGKVECPFCGTVKVAKAPMAPSVVGGRDKSAPPAEEPTQAVAEQVADAVRKLRRHVEDNCDYVGGAFPDEARRIHYGEAEDRGIYGETTPDEARALDEEGIEIFPLPGRPRRDD